MFVDHFLSKNFNNLFNKSINDVERIILDKVKENKNIFPKDFEKIFNWLNDRNVMTNYKELDFLERAFQGLAKNRRRGKILNLAVAELKKNYNLFEEKSIKEFFYVKKESIKEFSITNHHFKWWFALCLKGTITSLRLKPYNLVCLLRIAPFSY